MTDKSMQPPSEFLCPLSKTLMKEPMMSKDGINFEKNEILKWLNQGNNVCPVTGNKLTPSCLVSNKALEKKIKIFMHEEVKEACDPDSTALLQFVSIMPEKYLCPLTRQVMTHPMTSRDGITFERDAILKWLDIVDVCPVTGNPLCPSKIIPNKKLELEIERWHQDHGDAIFAMALQYDDKEVANAKAKDGIADHKNIIAKIRNAMNIAPHKPRASKPAGARSA